MIESAIYARLAADPEILGHCYRTALNLGADDEGTSGDATDFGIRIWPNRLHESIYPAIVYRRISTNRPRNLLGTDGLIESKIEVETWSASEHYATAKKVAERVKALLNKRDGLGWSAAGYTVAASWLDDEEDRLRKPIGEKQALWPTVLQEYVVWWYDSFD